MVRKPVTEFTLSIRNLNKGCVIRKADGSFKQQDDIGDFFRENGCRVEDVRVVLDDRSGSVRGFGFVDFADEDSLKKALSLNGAYCPSIARKPDECIEVRTSNARDSSSLLQMQSKTKDLEMTVSARRKLIFEFADRFMGKSNRRNSNNSDFLPGALEAIAAEQAKQKELRNALVYLERACKLIRTLNEQKDLEDGGNINTDNYSNVGSASEDGCETTASSSIGTDGMDLIRERPRSILPGMRGEPLKVPFIHDQLASLPYTCIVKNTFLEVEEVGVPLLSRSRTDPAKSVNFDGNNNGNTRSVKFDEWLANFDEKKKRNTRLVDFDENNNRCTMSENFDENNIGKVLRF